MGVHGLATFLREHQSTCAQPLQLAEQFDELTTFVIDGWSYVSIACSAKTWLLTIEFG